MPSDGCALEMALRAVGSMHKSMLSQSSVHAAGSLAGGGRAPTRSACQSSEEGAQTLSTSVLTALS
eukprot:1725508-Pleurochrysis_carterae.AAC.1